MEGQRPEDRALGDSVTAERLQAAPTEDLEEGEQPHHLLRANSIDFDGDRAYPRMNEYGWVVATDRSLRFVVPHTVDRRSVAVALDDVDGVEAEALVPKRLTVRSPDGEYTANLVDEADPEPVVEFLRSPPSPEPSTPPEEPGADAGSGTERTVETDGEGHGQTEDPIAKLDRLATLRDRGVLTDEEFTEKKQELLEQV